MPLAFLPSLRVLQDRILRRIGSLSRVLAVSLAITLSLLVALSPGRVPGWEWGLEGFKDDCRGCWTTLGLLCSPALACSSLPVYEQSEHSCPVPNIFSEITAQPIGKPASGCPWRLRPGGKLQSDLYLSLWICSIETSILDT